MYAAAMTDEGSAADGHFGRYPISYSDIDDPRRKDWAFIRSSIRGYNREWRSLSDSAT